MIYRVRHDLPCTITPDMDVYKKLNVEIFDKIGGEENAQGIK